MPTAWRTRWFVLWVAALAWLTAAPVLGQASGRYDGPIIDMHMHASWQVDAAGNPEPFVIDCMPGPCQEQPGAATTEDEVLRRTIRLMDQHRIVLGFLSGFDGTPTDLTPNNDRVRAWVAAAPDLFIPSAWVSRPGLPTIDFLREEYAAGRVRGLGEMATQYYGYRPDDPELEPYFAFAAAVDLPTHIHTAGVGAPLPRFRASAGNPMLLEEVLVRHPNLRLFVENSGFPFTDEFIAMAYQYPQLYGEVSTATWVLNRSAFYRHLRILVESGLSKRIMFGSDQMQWPETITLAIEAIQSADFLTAEQRADIFYNNAAGFLRLTQEEIDRHHGR